MLKVNKLKVVLIILSVIMFIVGGFIIMKVTIFNDDEKNLTKERGLKRDSSDEKDIVDTEEKSEDALSDLEKAPVNSSEYKNLSDGEYITDKGYTLKIENGVASIDGMLIVNKTYSVPSTFKPVNPNSAVTGERCNDCLDKEVIKAFNLMKSDATSMGLNIYMASGYRSYTYQEKLYNNYTAVSGVDGADTYSARAGHSEHQTGLCFDLNSVDDSFAYTDEGRWVNENAYLYGFIIRYPKGKENITGYQYESWHLRYVGVELASKLYNEGNWITMEEYFGITSVY